MTGSAPVPTPADEHSDAAVSSIENQMIILTGVEIVSLGMPCNASCSVGMWAPPAAHTQGSGNTHRLRLRYCPRVFPLLSK